MRHDYTQAILNALEANPGARLHAIAKAVGLHHESLARRLEILAKKRMILTAPDARALHYFPVKPEFARLIDRLVVCHSANDPRRAMLVLASERPCLVRDFVAELGLARSWVNLLVLRLAEQGLLARQSDGRWVLAWEPGEGPVVPAAIEGSKEPQVEGAGGVEADG